MSGKEMTEEVEYESDPEEAKLSLKMRRREASDDEEEGEEEGELREKVVRPIESYGESGGQDAVAEYEKEGEEEYVEEEEKKEEYERTGGGEVEVVAVEKTEEGNGVVEGELEEEKVVEVEYESDPEEAKLSLKMKRREASDDEEEGEEEGGLREKSGGQDVVVEYEEEGEEEYVEEVEKEEEYERTGGGEVEVVAVEKTEEGNGVVEGELEEEKVVEVEYESDPEEAKLSLKTRRREASDDEEEGELREKSGGQDAVAEYEEEGEEEYVEEEEKEEEYERTGGGEVEVVAVEKTEEGNGVVEGELEEKVVEVEYESDPEEAKLSLKTRRREASDDEDEEEEEEELRKKVVRPIESDVEWGGQGMVAEYEEGEEEYVEEEEEEEEYERTCGEVEVVAVEKTEEGNRVVEGELEEEKRGVRNDVSEINDDSRIDDVLQDEQKKEIEPYAVPMAGAFYMHDDRFRDNVGGRHRRTLGARKLWDSKDERKWGHDKFAEMTTQEWHYEERRKNSRGLSRGRGRNRGSDRGYARENRPRVYNNNNNNNQNNAVKGVRGRGPRRYQPSFKNNNEAPLTQNKQSVKSVEKPSHVNSGRSRAHSTSVESDAFPPRKQMFGSNLSIASPPFYPSGSSMEDTSLLLKRDVQANKTNRNIRSSIADKSSTSAQSSAMLRGKNIVDSIGMDTLYIDDSVTADKPLNALQMLPSGSSPSFNSTQPQQSRDQGRGMTSLTQVAYEPVSNNQVNRVPPATLPQTAQKNPGQNRGLYSARASGQQFLQRLNSGSQASSPPKAAVPVNSFETGELESPSEFSKSKTALFAKGKASVKGSGRGSFLYGDGQVMGASGNMGSGHGNQNFPAFLPVMQFAGQHPGGGVGVPAVGMAYPGYVAQPQLGNSKMTWLPALAGATGALGTTYSPYLSVDGSYHDRSSGQTSSAVSISSKEISTTKDSDWNPTQKPEIANNDFGQRQKNPRRYTEMKFDQ